MTNDDDAFSPMHQACHGKSAATSFESHFVFLQPCAAVKCDISDRREVLPCRHGEPG